MDTMDTMDTMDGQPPADGTPPPQQPQPPQTPQPQTPQPVRAGINPIALGIIVLVGTFFLYQVVGSVLTIAVIGFEGALGGAADGSANGLRIMTIVMQVLMLALPAVLAVKLAGWDVRTTLRLRAPKPVPVAAVIVGVAALQFVLQGYLVTQNWILRTYILPEALQSLIDVIDKLMNDTILRMIAIGSVPEGLLVWTTIALAPAFCEEIVFRGAVQGAFERGMRLRWTFILTGVIFALYHLHPLNFPVLAVLGVLLSVAVWRGDSLWLGIIAHLTNNSMAVAEAIVTGPDAMNTPAGTPDLETLVVSLGALVVFLAAAVVFWKSTRPPATLSPTP